MKKSAVQLPRRQDLATAPHPRRVFWLSAAEERSFLETLLYFLVLLSLTTPLFGVAFWLAAGLGTAAAGSVAGAITLVAVACITLWFLLQLRPEAYEPRRRRALREARLRELVPRAQALGRLPHRALEHSLREFPTHNDFARHLRRHPLGSAIVVFDRTSRFKVKPTATEAFYEPVRIDAFTPQVRSLANDLMGRERDATTGFEPLPRRVTWRGLGSVFRSIFVVFGCIVAVQVMFGDFLSGPWLVGISAFVGVFLAGSARLLMPHRREHFVIPGGMVVREYHVWSRRQVIRPVFADAGRLVVDLRKQRTWVDDGERLHLFPCDPRCAWVLLAAWISRARRPSVEELRTFFGPDAELGSISHRS